MTREIMVSIICNTYNHERYICEALESFLMQKTEFPFEILIHDDASTDSTAKIISEYANRFPDLIKPVYQQENQYSKGVRISATYQYPRSSGRFIALCEGDDYWTDENKLQKQVSALLSHPEVDVCAHKAEKVKDGKIIGYVEPKNETCVIPLEEVILGGGGYVATNSLIFRREAIIRETPMRKIVSLDFVAQIQGALRGGMLYLNDCMSAYRVNSIGSWTKRMGSDRQKQIDHNNTINKMLLCLDEFTEHKYHDAITEKIKINDFSTLRLQKRYKEMLQKEFKDIYRKMPFRKRLKIRYLYIKSLIERG